MITGFPKPTRTTPESRWHLISQAESDRLTAVGGIAPWYTARHLVQRISAWPFAMSGSGLSAALWLC